MKIGEIDLTTTAEELEEIASNAYMNRASLIALMEQIATAKIKGLEHAATTRGTFAYGLFVGAEIYRRRLEEQADKVLARDTRSLDDATADALAHLAANGERA